MKNVMDVISGCAVEGEGPGDYYNEETVDWIGVGVVSSHGSSGCGMCEHECVYHTGID